MAIAYQQYSELRSKNWSVEHISTFLGAMLKEDTATAYSECKSFRDCIKQKENEMESLHNDLLTKYPTHNDYLSHISNLTDPKDVEVELSVCHDVIHLLELKKTMLTPEVKENDTLLHVLHNANLL